MRSGWQPGLPSPESSSPWHSCPGRSPRGGRSRSADPPEPRRRGQNWSMTAPPTVNPQLSERPAILGLRERKKARTRAAIQDHALRLFHERGYDATTVEQIAEAAEVSPSTFFRYFPTKEDVVAYDALDPLVMAAWRAQPADMKPIAAMRKAMWDVFASMDRTNVEEMMGRGRLLFGQPELRQAAIGELL